MSVGRPPKWSDPDALQFAVDAYFDKCDAKIIRVQHAHSKGITVVETPTPYTMAGLAYHLGIARETLNNYQTQMLTDANLSEGDKMRFRDIIMHARKRIEEDNITKGMAGVYEPKINALNLASNYGYSTKAETEHKGTLTVQVVNYGAPKGE